MAPTLYRKTVAIAEDYLGPAAERFMSRQIRFHLQKEPEEITPADLAKLEEWFKVALALLTDDRDVVAEFAARIKVLHEA